MPVPIVFLSHSSRDADVARRLKDVLARHTQGAIEWWLSSDGQSIRGGKNWRSEVEQALRDCRLLFLLFTPTARQSAWVQYEAGFADALGKDMIPVALPGLDIDAIPGPLQHKQGFNLRGASGLNNIISVTNRILGRHDLLSFDETHYDEAFSASTGVMDLAQVLDIHVEEIKLTIKSPESVIGIITTRARKVIGNDLVASSEKDETVLAGPGFVIREERQLKKRPATATEPAHSEIMHLLNGEIVAPALFELLPVLSDSEVIPFLRNGSIESKLRAGSAVLTSQAKILSCMRDTPMRWSAKGFCSFDEVTFSSRARDINQPSMRWFGVRGPSAPEPYRPREMRYDFTVRWQSGFPGTTIASLLALLMERLVIFTAER